MFNKKKIIVNNHQEKKNILTYNNYFKNNCNYIVLSFISLILYIFLNHVIIYFLIAIVSSIFIL